MLFTVSLNDLNYDFFKVQFQSSNHALERFLPSEVTESLSISWLPERKELFSWTALISTPSKEVKFTTSEF